MLNEAKKWVANLEKALTQLSEKYGESVEELDKKFDDFYYDGGSAYDEGAGPGPYQSSIDAFYADYENQDEDEEDEQEAYDDIYQKMREFADRRDYTLSNGEIETIIEQCEQEGDSIFDCSDGMLREIVDDWVADHSCLGKYF